MSTVNNEGNLIFDSVEVNGQKVYVAEFKATGPFSLHIERRESGRITVYQKSYENGKYATVKNVDIAPQDTIIDAEVPGGVFPKWIKIKSSSEVEVAEVTFESAQSGGGAGDSGGVKFRYFDANKLTSTTTQIVVSNYVGLIQTTKNDGTKTIACLGSMLANAPITPTPKMLAVITDTKVILDGGELSTFEEACAIFNITEEELSVAEITKEQFYNYGEDV